MKLNRKQLRKLIKESMEADSVYGSFQPASISDLYGLGSQWVKSWELVHPQEILNHFNQHREASGMTADEYIQKVEEQIISDSKIEDIKAAILSPGGSSPAPGTPLSAKDIMALMISDKDPNSEYKLSLERLNTFWGNPQLNSNDLTPEEQSIINQS